MWWQQLPSAAITFGLLVLPGIPGIFFGIYRHGIFNLKVRKLDGNAPVDRKLLQRDKLLMGRNYLYTGLDYVPEA